MKILKPIIGMMLVFALFTPSVVLAGTTVVLANGEWAPYLGKELKNGGPISHLVSEAFKQQGIDVEYKWYGDAWKRAYKDALSGKKAQGSLVWSKKPEREKEMFYSDSIVIPGTKNVFFHLKNADFDWQQVSDLKGLKIGGVLGYTYGEALDKAISDGTVKLERIDKEGVNFKKLLKGRIDLVASGLEVGKEILKKEYTAEEAAQITFHPKPFRITGYHLILTRALAGNQALMEKFDQGFRQIQASGLYDRIYKDMESGKYN